VCLCELDSASPQAQAELLLERSVNHYRGANEQIAGRLHGWLGHLAMQGRLNELFRTAINSNDLTVRVAAIEVDIAARNLVKEPATIDRLEPSARSGEALTRINAMWDLALIGNRGVDPARIFEILSSGLHDENESVRSWSAESLAIFGSDLSIRPLLAVLHDDPSPAVRERAACGLAQSGMFSAAQRMTAVPSLLDFADDGSLDDRTRGWVFQALRDITGQSLPHDAVAWRDWYADYRR
jgi:HEAT repeat protein